MPTCSKRGKPPQKQPPQSPNLANLLMKYLSVQREKSRKYSQRWQQQHTADELKTIAAAVNYLSEHGISNLDELDASLSSVSDKAYSIREGMKTAEQRMKELQKLIEYGKNYTRVQAHSRRAEKAEKRLDEQARQVRGSPPRRADPMERSKPLSPCKSAERNKDACLSLNGNRNTPTSKHRGTADYTKLKDTRAEVAELQKIRKCVDIALRQPTSRSRHRTAPSGMNRSDKGKDGQAVRLVRPMSCLRNVFICLLAHR